jgi:hypothetical protein
MAAPRIKSLGKTGLVTRAKAEAAVRAWKKKHGDTVPRGRGKSAITVKDTATGRGLVAFRVPDEGVTGGRTARKKTASHAAKKATVR